MSKYIDDAIIPLGSDVHLRDFFAAKAMGDMLVMFGLEADYEDMASNCYAYADAMLKARES